VVVRHSAIIHREDNWYVAECPEVGIASQGSTVEKATENLREATELYFEEFPDKRTSGLREKSPRKEK
jgi:predicted RNase H-like HicB family nuclease